MKEFKKFKKADIYIRSVFHDDDHNVDLPFKHKEQGYLIDKGIGFCLDEKNGLYGLIDIPTGMTFAHCRKEDIMTMYKIYKPALDKKRESGSYMFAFMAFRGLPELEVEEEKDENGQPMLKITKN